MYPLPRSAALDEPGLGRPEGRVDGPVGDDVSDDREAISAFLRDYPVDFALPLVTHGQAGRQGRVQGLPTACLVNPGGRVVHRQVGKHAWSGERLLQRVRDLKRPKD